MKILIITVGKPKLSYAQDGFQDYIGRLKHFHDIRIIHVADKLNDADHLLQAAGNSYKVGLVIEGQQLTSHQLAEILDKKASLGRELSFIIGGPEGLPEEVITACDFKWSLSKLTFPHDLAMLIVAETLYRSSTLNRGIPYHK